MSFQLIQGHILKVFFAAFGVRDFNMFLKFGPSRRFDEFLRFPESCDNIYRLTCFVCV